MTLAIKSGLPAGTLTNLSPSRTGHFARIERVAAAIGLGDPLRIGRNPIGRRNIVPESGNELSTFRRRERPGSGQDFIHCGHARFVPSVSANGKHGRRRTRLGRNTWSNPYYCATGKLRLRPARSRTVPRVQGKSDQHRPAEKAKHPNDRITPRITGIAEVGQFAFVDRWIL